MKVVSVTLRERKEGTILDVTLDDGSIVSAAVGEGVAVPDAFGEIAIQLKEYVHRSRSAGG